MDASAERVSELLAPDGISAVETPISQLYDLAEDALTNIDALVNDTQGNTNAARQKLRQLKSKRIALWGQLLAGDTHHGGQEVRGGWNARIAEKSRLECPPEPSASR